MDCSLPGSSVHGILQARILEWVAMPLPGDLPNPRIKPVSLISPALAGRFFTTSTFWEALIECILPNSNVEILTPICWYLEVRFGGDG